MGQLKASGQALGAQAIVGITGFAPPTLHAIGARAASGLTRRVWNLVVTNVPGPQFPLCTRAVRGCWPPTRSSPGQEPGSEHRIDVLRRRGLLRLER